MWPRSLIHPTTEECWSKIEGERWDERTFKIRRSTRNLERNEEVARHRTVAPRLRLWPQFHNSGLIFDPTSLTTIRGAIVTRLSFNAAEHVGANPTLPNQVRIR